MMACRIFILQQTVKATINFSSTKEIFNLKTLLKKHRYRVQPNGPQVLQWLISMAMAFLISMFPLSAENSA